MKRLKENATMDAEIGPSGDVVVEGHHVGKLDGFRFTADQSAQGEDAKAIRTAAQKALAAEFEARAGRIAAAPNGDFALGMDGYLRWLGAPVATLSADEDWLSPSLILLADEQLTGPALEQVRTRLARFVGHHTETHLKPLTDMRQADELSGIARGIAFRLIENCGIVQRRDIAADIKALDQDGRAALRRYGVRFGYYHIFVPALIKPAPAGLLTLLWAVKNDAREKPGYDDVVTLLASGRTSLVTDQGFDKTFFKLAGYRHLGPRAVRVDILERLADLIRPCIFWKPGSELPDGAYGDGKFVVTPAMLSILGATAEDMTEVLKALGYRHEQVEAATAETVLTALRVAHGPKTDPATSEASGEPAQADTADQEQPAEAAGDQGPDQPQPEAQPTSEEAPQPGPDTAPPATAAEQMSYENPSETSAYDQPTAADVAASKPAAAEVTAEPAQDDAAGAEQAANESKAEPEAEAEPPAPVLVWRQGRFERRPDQRRRRPDDQQARAGDQQRQSRGKPRDDKRGGKPKGKRPPRREDGPRQATARPPRQRERQADPDSPFAKLQALKEQLEK